MTGLRYLAMSVAAIVFTAAVASAQEMPADYKAETKVGAGGNAFMA